jgi:hypothetical protein
MVKVRGAPTRIAPDGGCFATELIRVDCGAEHAEGRIVLLVEGNAVVGVELVDVPIGHTVVALEQAMDALAVEHIGDERRLRQMLWARAGRTRVSDRKSEVQTRRARDAPRSGSSRAAWQRRRAEPARPHSGRARPEQRPPTRAGQR